MRTTTLLLFSCFAFPPAFGQLVLNEVDYDQPSTDNAEFLELKNTGSAPVALQNVRIALVNGEGGTPVIYRTYASSSWPELAAGAYFTLCGDVVATANCDGSLAEATNNIQNGGTDAIVLLLMPDSTVIDQLSYEGTLVGYAEGEGTSAGDQNGPEARSIGRFPDGSDSNDNDADFIRMCPSPGAANVNDTTACETPSSIVEHGDPPALSIIQDPANGLVWLRYDGPASEAIVFEVFALDGSLIASRSTARSSWAWDTGGRRNCMLLVRARTATGAVTKRMVLP